MTLNTSEVRIKVSKILSETNIDSPPVPIETIAKQLGIQVQFELLPNKLSGLLYREDKKVKPIIGVNRLHPEVRQRFTIAHEIGHFILHKEPVHVDREYDVKFRDPNSSLANNDSEIEANKFAAEMLMPIDFLKKDIDNRNINIPDDDFIEILSQRYEVSMQAMIYRLQNLGYISKV